MVAPDDVTAGQAAQKPIGAGLGGAHGVTAGQAAQKCEASLMISSRSVTAGQAAQKENERMG